MANNPYVNKVVYGGQTLIDISSDTVTADKLMQGYTAHDRTGALITGTATGGGGSVTQDQDGYIVLPPDGGGSPSVSGLVYETGTFTPSEDITNPSINFSNTHTTRPFHVLISDIDDTTPTDNSMSMWSMTSWYDMFGTTIGTYYARTQYAYQNNSPAFGGNFITGLTGATTSYMSYFLTESGVVPYGGSTRYWRAGRTYKWIAVWKPTT